MKFKFGDKVQVTAVGFYKGAKGVVVYHDSMEDKYEVQLEFGRTKTFYAEHLKGVKK